jgi:3-oxoacyl-[acyl-carrier protein] reductase
MQRARWRLQGFDGRVAMVTGAAQGIGRRIAEDLHGQGARVALLDVSPAPDTTWLADSDRAHVLTCDITDEQAVDEAVQAVEERWGDVTVLVNNAGILESATIAETTLDSWRRQFEVNVTGAFLCSRRVLPGMQRASYGRIVSIGSSAGKNGGARAVAAYAASKAALMSLARSIASEYAGDGITSNALAPALIDTDMIAGLRDLADRIPVGRLGGPADVAYAACFLASEDASFITGEVMDVNGGFLID